MSRTATTDLVNKIFAFCEAYSGVAFFPYQAQFAKRIIRSVLENDGEEITALFSRQCLTGDTEILMADRKTKRIRDVVTGDSVMGFDYDHIRPSEVTNAYYAGMQEVYLLKLRSGEKIKATQNHRFLDKYSRLFKPLYAFEAGDEIGYIDRTNKLKFSRIKSLESIGEQDVYDLEILGAETFVANQFIVHNSGKSETVATISGGLAILLPQLANTPMFADDSRFVGFKNGVLIGIFAPALHQAQISFNRLKERMFSKHSLAIMEDPEINVGLDTNNGQNVTLTNGSVITCMSASEGSNIEGKSYMIVIIDEAQDVSNFKYTKSIFPMGAFYNATYILIGTPTTSKGFFFESIERNKREYENGTGRRNHFEYGYKTVLKYNPKYEKHIQGAIRKLGEESDEFQMSYNLRWIFERGMFVDPVKFDHNMHILCGIVLADKSRKHVAGIDCGKKSDSTVVTILEVDYDNPVIVEESKDMVTPDYIAYNTIIKAWLELTGDNYEEQYPEIMDFLSNFNIVRLAVDATGAGSPIADRIAANVDYEVIPYAFSSVGKSILYKYFDTEIKSKRFGYPADDETQQTREYRRFIEQMTELQKTYSGQNLVVAHPPERGKHDDYPDSAALAVWASKGDDVSKPINEQNPFVQARGESRGFYNARNTLTARRR
jgi:hypothetical protein